MSVASQKSYACKLSMMKDTPFLLQTRTRKSDDPGRCEILSPFFVCFEACWGLWCHFSCNGNVFAKPPDSQPLNYVLSLLISDCTGDPSGTRRSKKKKSCGSVGPILHAVLSSDAHWGSLIFTRCGWGFFGERDRAGEQSLYVAVWCHP